MMNRSQPEPADATHGGGLRIGGRQVVAIVIAVLLIVLIAANNDDTNISLIFFDITLPLWIVLAVTALLGVGIGMLLGARRTKRKYMSV
jgi:uncharacterized integral membrane protein